MDSNNPYWHKPVGGITRTNTAHDFLYAMTWEMRAPLIGNAMLYFIQMIKRPMWLALWKLELRTRLKRGEYKTLQAAK